jgi:peptidoglycan/xylan/chitin deacetylase (PgdA/CDA1 family)
VITNRPSSVATKVPILVYHSISDDPHPYIGKFAVSPRTFAQHLDAIRDADMHPLTVSDFVALRTANDLPPRPIVITFDDGWKDNATTAVRELSKRSIPATLYVTTGFLQGRAVRTHMEAPACEALHWDDLGPMAAAGIELGAHTVTHPALDTVPLDVARREVSDSRSMLEDHLGTAVRSFAYPHGYSNRAVRSIVADLGFDSACVVGNALSSERDSPLTLSRILVRNDTTIEQYRSWLQGTGAPVAPRRDAVQTMVWRQYRRTRAIVRQFGATTTKVHTASPDQLYR